MRASSLKSLSVQLKRAQRAAKEQGTPDTRSLPVDERKLLEEIRERTDERNRDNVERTRAYLDFYQKHTDIHWALLAHLVSRNAGWNMTDLRGELLPRLLSAKEQRNFFLFLERGNWLIFRDAYPQLLLYEESVRRQTNLFHLLPYFHTSVFVSALWNEYWNKGDSELLTVGLIMNEQQHLEVHLMQEQSYRSTVLDTLPFAAQEMLALNQILFPCHGEQPLRLIGQNVSHFASLLERIALGKRLYALLFRDPAQLADVYPWASSQTHTGSRKDFWPHLFHDIRESVPGKPHQKRMEGCRLRSGQPRLYSPPLRHAWERVEHTPPDPQDWYRDRSALALLSPTELPSSFDMGEAYCRTLEKVELAVIAKGKIFGG
ncbi:DUF2515 family protein [Brevibacillus sp. GCM10020057]|uniref:DUF2515 family protein n=1 Tax=Brevibacillus sp. GCM10020057 TaxID=3317327 RepID=UPI00362826CE